VKQVAQNYRSGELALLDVPVPACRPGGVLVRTHHSLISTGTELMKVREAGLSLLGKARARPDQVRKVLDSVAQAGPAATYKKVVNRLDSYTPLGYSLCGLVTAVGRGAEELAAGQLVACAGNEHALHAEVNWVPLNLCVPVPHGVDTRLASFATVGAIALHGVRRAEVQLGEAACVVGLGLVGQLVVRLLVAAGVRVLGVDPSPARCTLAEEAGALVCAAPSDEGVERIRGELLDATAGLGADHVLLTAGDSSSAPVRVAARLARDRARVVDIGKCRLDLPWNEFYEKELDLRLSRSYGPGRYDPRYELDGVDYPAGYVRWTERRNMACFLDLVARSEIHLESLVSGVFPIDDAVEVYARLKRGELPGVGFLFEYPERAEGNAAVRALPARISPSAGGSAAGRARATVRLGFLGAGNYASTMLLPHLAGRQDVELVQVVTTSPLSAVTAQRRFGFARSSTDASTILDDDSIDAVFVVTRHSSHTELTCRALERGKAVFVEKPLALSGDQLERVLEVIDATGSDRLMVGFNRRFAPLLRDLRTRFDPRRTPALLHYLVNAGSLPPTSWYRNTEVEGSRFTGEGGHFIDTLSWWLDARPVRVHAVSPAAAGDLLVTLEFDDGSVATVAYTTTGHHRFPKETFHAVSGGRIARLDNFRSATVWSGRRPRVQRSRWSIDKGQRHQLERFLEAVRSGGPMPISLTSLVATTRATLAAVRSLATGRPEEV